MQDMWERHLPLSYDWDANVYATKDDTLDKVVVDTVLHSDEWVFMISSNMKSQLGAEMNKLALEITRSTEDDIKHITARIKAIKEVQKMNGWDTVEAPRDIKKVYVYTVNDTDYSVQHAGEETSVQDRINAMKKLNHEDIK